MKVTITSSLTSQMIGLHLVIKNFLFVDINQSLSRYIIFYDTSNTITYVGGITNLLCYFSFDYLSLS